MTETLEFVQIPAIASDALLWFVFEPPGAEDYPEWLRSAAIDPDGIAWASAAFVHEHEPIAVLRAGLAREPVVFCDGHFYLRIPWMREQSSQFAEVLQRFERGVQHAVPSPRPSGTVH